MPPAHLLRADVHGYKSPLCQDQMYAPKTLLLQPVKEKNRFVEVALKSMLTK
jgi:hypothetical protein